MFLTVIIFSILPDFFSGGYAVAVNETDIVHYLYRVGELKIREEGHRPHDYFNNAVENWSFNDARVKEFVGLVCDRMDSEAGSEIKTACKLFERTAAYFVLRYYNARTRGTAISQTSLVRFYMNYGSKKTVVYFQQVKEMIPLVCKKTEVDLFILLDLDIQSWSQVDHVKEECDRLQQDVLTYLRMSHQRYPDGYKNGKYASEVGNYTITIALVKTMLPRVCDTYYNTPTWATISRTCEYLFHWTGSMLEYITNRIAQVYTFNAYNDIKMQYARSDIQIHDVKPFIVNYCGKIPPDHQWKVACEYLLKEHMELMMEKN